MNAFKFWLAVFSLLCLYGCELFTGAPTETVMRQATAEFLKNNGVPTEIVDVSAVPEKYIRRGWSHTNGSDAILHEFKVIERGTKQKAPFINKDYWKAKVIVRGECNARIWHLFAQEQKFKTAFNGQLELTFMKDDYGKWTASKPFF